MTIYTSCMVVGKGTSKVVPISMAGLPGYKPVILHNMFIDGVLVKTGPYCPIRYEAPPVVKRMQTLITPPIAKDMPYRHSESGARRSRGRRL